MKLVKFLITSLLAYTTLPACADTMSSSAYKAQKDSIKSAYKVNKEKCSPLSGNQADICKAQAKATEKTSLSELDYNNNPNSKTKFEWIEAKAHGEYDIAKEKCDDFSGNQKDICIKEAKASRDKIIADAKANREAAEAHQEAIDAQKTAKHDKNKADYQVAKEKCDQYQGSVKDQCIDSAKNQYRQ